VADPGHAAILLFTVALGGMVGVVSRSGGTRALVGAIARRATTRRAGMLTTYVAGLLVFFDDYANCLLVGNTARPYTDELKISREKLAYLVDSTAAPIATVALISTWIGFQLGILGDVLPSEAGPYELFLQLLPYSFYSFFTLAFVLLVAATGRDFGPMRRAEERARRRGELLRPGASPLMDRELTDMRPAGGVRIHWATAALPVGSVIAFVAAGLVVSGAGPAGAGASLRQIIAAADSYAVLLWASFGGSLVALATAVGLRTISIKEAINAWVGGAKAMMMAVLILVLAWAIGSMCMDYLDTGAWLLSQVSPSARLLPLITFLIAAAIAFATGSSFSTMAIVIPIAAPMAWALTGDASGLSEATAHHIRFATLASVLSGAVFGDHCSPISDTTIMSSMASASDHIDHVRTQIPYAALCAAVAGLVGFLPAGFGVSPWLTLPLGVAMLGGALFALGKPTD
jgi:Na+/H+ antiporter NhaC